MSPPNFIFGVVIIDGGLLNGFELGVYDGVELGGDLNGLVIDGDLYDEGGLLNGFELGEGLLPPEGDILGMERLGLLDGVDLEGLVVRDGEFI